MPRERAAPHRAVDREIQVEASGEEGSAPKAFTLGPRRHVVAEVVSTWSDESFGGGFRRDAWLRHQRLFYRVRTEAGELFDIYFDFGERRRRGRGRWVMHRRLAATAATEAPAPEPSPESETPAPEPPSETGP